MKHKIDLSKVDRIEERNYNRYDGKMSYTLQINLLFTILRNDDIEYTKEDILYIIENTDYNIVYNNDSKMYNYESIFDIGGNINNKLFTILKVFLKYHKYDELTYFLSNIHFVSDYTNQINKRKNKYLLSKTNNNKEIRKVNKI